MIGRKHKKVCTTPNYIKHFLIFASAITGCISISVSFLGITIGFKSFSIGLEIFAIVVGIKRYKSIIKKKKKSMMREYC